MKRTIFAIVMITLLVLPSGCGQNTSAAPGFTKNDVYLSIDGNQYRCKDNIQDVIENLGSHYAYSDGLSCAYDGLDKTYTYEMAEFYTNPLPEGDLVSEIYTENLEVTTSKGISVGAAKEQVLAAYGDGEDMGNLLIYKVPDSKNSNQGSLCFEMENDKVIAIFVTTEAV